METQITAAKIINYHRIGKDTKTSLMSQCAQFVEWIF